MTISNDERDLFVGLAMTQAEGDNARALKYVKERIEEKGGWSEATERDIQAELIKYAAYLDREQVVNMWAELAFRWFEI